MRGDGHRGTRSDKRYAANRYTNVNHKREYPVGDETHDGGGHYEDNDDDDDNYHDDDDYYYKDDANGTSDNVLPVARRKRKTIPNPATAVANTTATRNIIDMTKTTDATSATNNNKTEDTVDRKMSDEEKEWMKNIQEGMEKCLWKMNEITKTVTTFGQQPTRSPDEKETSEERQGYDKSQEVVLAKKQVRLGLSPLL